MDRQDQDQDEDETFGDFDHSDNIYFETIFRQLDQKFDTDEDEDLFVNNVFRQTVGKELRLCRSRGLAFGLEKLLRFAKLENIVSFVRVLADSLKEVVFHPSASHSWQVALSVCFKYMAQKNEAFLEAVEKKDDSKVHQHLATLTKIVVDSSKYFLGNLDEVLGNSQACHVLCTTMELLCGLEPQKGKPSKDARQEPSTPEKIKIPPIFQKNSKRLVRHILQQENLKALMLESTSSRVLQTTISVLESIDEVHCHKFANKFLELLGEESGGITKMLTHATASPTLERLILVCPEETRTALWQDHFKTGLEKLVVDPIANFVVQKFIGYANKPQVEIIYGDLEPLWDKFSDEGHLGILVELTAACVKHCCCQAKLVERLATLLHCYEPVDRRTQFFPLTLYWLYFEDLKGENFSLRKVNHHGSLMLQNIFKFQKPYLMVESLLETLPSNLKSIICSPAGSFVMEAFVTSRTLGVKNRLTLAECLQGLYEELACDKFGSRFLEQLWKNVDANTRTSIIKELAQSNADLINHPFGHFIYKQSAMHLYLRHPDKWLAYQAQGVKNKNMFDNILGDTSSQSKKRRRFR